MYMRSKLSEQDESVSDAVYLRYKQRVCCCRDSQVGRRTAAENGSEAKTWRTVDRIGEL